MAKTKTQKFNQRDVYFDEKSGIRLTKRFPAGESILSHIVVTRFGLQPKNIAIPETAIDRMISSLLELKVLMADGKNYNSGSMRVALLDGSGVEFDVKELSDTGKGNAIGLAKHLIEEIEDADDEEEDEDDLTVRYRCPKCGEKWEEEYTSACDSECGKCGTENISALMHKKAEDDWTDAEEKEWEDA